MNPSIASLIAESEGPAVWITVLFGLLLVGLITCLALEEKLHAKKSLIAGVFAIVCLLIGAFLNILPFEEIVVGSHEVIGSPTPIELELESEDGEAHAERVIVKGEGADAEKTDENPGTDNELDETETTSESEAELHELHIDGHRLNMPVYIPGIDWSVIAIILGSSLFVEVTSRSGLFTWIAIRVTKLSKGDPLYLLILYGVMTVFFSAVLNNVTAMIIVGSLTAVSLNKLNRNSMLLGFLLVEGLLTNIGGLLTLISSVPNIIVGTTAGISFVAFFVRAAPFVLVATAITLWMGARFFNVKRLTDEEEITAAQELVNSFDENDGIESKNFFWFATVMLILFVFTIAFTSALPGISNLGMGFVAMAFAGILLIRYRSEVDRFYKAVDWDLLGFFMALFVVIYVMEYAGVLNAIGGGLKGVLSSLSEDAQTQSGTNSVDASILLVGAAAFSSVTDNIPLAAMLASILHSFGTPESSGLWWSVIFGANLGGNLTPIGSASTLVAVTIMHKHELHVSFFAFVKKAIPYAIAQIIMAVLYVVIILPFLPNP